MIEGITFSVRDITDRNSQKTEDELEKQNAMLDAVGNFYTRYECIFELLHSFRV